MVCKKPAQLACISTGNRQGRGHDGLGDDEQAPHEKSAARKIKEALSIDSISLCNPMRPCSMMIMLIPVLILVVLLVGLHA